MYGWRWVLLVVGPHSSCYAATLVVMPMHMFIKLNQEKGGINVGNEKERYCSLYLPL